MFRRPCLRSSGEDFWPITPGEKANSREWGINKCFYCLALKNEGEIRKRWGRNFGQNIYLHLLYSWFFFIMGHYFVISIFRYPENPDLIWFDLIWFDLIFSDRLNRIDVLFDGAINLKEKSTSCAKLFPKHFNSFGKLCYCTAGSNILKVRFFSLLRPSKFLRINYLLVFLWVGILWVKFEGIFVLNLHFSFWDSKTRTQQKLDILQKSRPVFEFFEIFIKFLWQCIEI